MLLDLSALQYVPLNDLVGQIVFAEDGTGVESVMAAGRWVVRDRKLLTVDIEALKRKAQEAVERLNAANMRSAAQCAVKRSAPSTRSRLRTAARLRSFTSQKLEAAIA